MHNWMWSDWMYGFGMDWGRKKGGSIDGDAIEET